MDANTITAICATVIAVASLVVSVTEARATREHNRQSIRPLLSFECRRQENDEAGIRLYNSGLGPAIITSSTVTLDGNVLGPWEVETVNPLLAPFKVRPRWIAIRVGKSFPAGVSQMVLAIDEYREPRDGDFWELISSRLRIEIRYESLYGGERFEVTYTGPFDGAMA
jgi:hypothetical protein